MDTHTPHTYIQVYMLIYVIYNVMHGIVGRICFFKKYFFGRTCFKCEHSHYLLGEDWDWECS